MEKELKQILVSDNRNREEISGYAMALSVIERERIVFRRQWENIKNSTPFNVKAAQSLLNQILEFKESLIDSRNSQSIICRKFKCRFVGV